jgi:pimeloyl-ACP methyl ester carboxylesterase
MEPIARRLVDHGVVICVDLPDHGAAADDASIEPDDSLRDLNAVIDSLAGTPTIVAGFSYGAYLTARLLASPPAHLRGAALFAGFTRLGETEAAMRVTMAEQIESAALSSNALADVAVGLFLGREDASEAASRTRNTIESTPTARLARSLRRIAGTANAGRQVTAFRAPVTVLHGRHDETIPLSSGEALAALGPTPVRTLETASHLLPWTHTNDCVNAILEHG